MILLQYIYRHTCVYMYYAAIYRLLSSLNVAIVYLPRFAEMCENCLLYAGEREKVRERGGGSD